jgi:hypothetical protein
MNDPKYDKLRARHRRSAAKAIAVTAILLATVSAFLYVLLF